MDSISHWISSLGLAHHPSKVQFPYQERSAFPVNKRRVFSGCNCKWLKSVAPESHPSRVQSCSAADSIRALPHGERPA
jgi:hypothetical protein